MSSFSQTINPTPFGFFDGEAPFQQDADAMTVFVQRKLGSDVISVELTSKQIWACFEEAACEYSRALNEMRIKSELINVLGLPTGSTMTNIYPRATLEYLLRLAEPYASVAGTGGVYDQTLGYFDLEVGRQDYNIYTELKLALGPNSGSLAIDSLPSGSKSQIRLVEVFHVEPLAAQQFLLNASNITNFLATNFNYESYVNSTVFYVLPVFEDVLRRGMLETAFRVRRSNYSYDIVGTNLRIYPIPTTDLQTGKLFVRAQVGQQNPLIDILSGSNGVSFVDDTLHGISGPNNVPLDNLPYSTVTQPARQWIRQYTMALCKELLGLVRSKFDTVPIPGAELKLNGPELIQQAREDKEKLMDQLHEFLDSLTRDNLLTREVTIAEDITKLLRTIPFPTGKSILIG